MLGTERKSEKNKAFILQMSKNGKMVMLTAKPKKMKQPTSFSLRKQVRGFYIYQAFLGERNLESVHSLL